MPVPSRGHSPATPAPERRTRISLAVTAALAAAVPAATVHAEPAAADAGATAAGGALQEVVVTARKRVENLQEVPLSIDVFSKRDLQNLNITSFDDYAQKTPSISFISEGPGTQTFVMRGVSDGSNPNYANTSSTGFFIDDVSMSYSGAQPDLRLYDLERIEVLNGPQGTTFGAGAMSGAIRYITNKPDVNAFSAGVDLDAGKIQGAQENWTEQGFLNVPLISGRLGLRVSAVSDSHGGFIDNVLTTRTWVNGAVSNNALWAHNDYNRSHLEGGRAALKLQFSEGWSALVTSLYQRLASRGAWDEDPKVGPRKVARFGPEQRGFETKLLEGRLDGDLGIGDLVFATSYWSQPTRQYNEYSEYMQNFNAGTKYGLPGGFPGTQEGLTCLTDPYFSLQAPTSSPTPVPYSGCRSPEQFYEYHSNTHRWANELRLASKPGRLHWLAGLYWERTQDKDYGSTYYIPNLQYAGQAMQTYFYTYGVTQAILPPGVWYSYTERSDYLQTTEFGNVSFDITPRLNVEAGVVHFHSDFSYYTPYVDFAYYSPTTSPPSFYKDNSHKWNSKLGFNYKVTDRAMVYGIFSQGFRDGGTNAGDPQSCYNAGVPYRYTPDTLNNYELGWKTTNLNGRLLWNGATYLMDWKQLQVFLYNPQICQSSSFNINIGDARIYGVESNVDYRLNEKLSLQASASYTDSRVISASLPGNEIYVNERLPFVPYFSWSWNARYEQPLGGNLRGYVQFDMAHKGDMWNDINPNNKNLTDVNGLGLPRILQPAYTIMNLRFGLSPEGASWLAELYVTNLTDKNAIVYSNTGNFDLRLTTNEPRVYGLRVNYRWGKEKNAE